MKKQQEIQWKTLEDDGQHESVKQIPVQSKSFKG